MFPQYKDYNRLSVKIYGSVGTEGYVISNVNTKGNPGSACECHIESITIDEPAVSQNNPDNFGIKGSVVLLDYKDAVFNYLSHHLADFINLDTHRVIKSLDKAELYPRIHIEADCFTNNLTIDAYIIGWSFEFVGTTPSIRIEWRNVGPSSISEAKDEIPEGSFWSKPLSLIENARKVYSSGGIELVYGDNNESISTVAESLVFNSPEGVIYHTVHDQSQNKLVDVYRFICENANVDGKPLTYEQVDTKIFRIKTVDPSKNSPQNNRNETTKSLIFIQNGCYPAYSTYKGKTVIPMSSFNFESSLTKLVLQTSIIPGLNGTLVNGVTQTGTSEEATANANATSQDSENQAITIKFDCYNVMCFDRNNFDSYLELLIFNEFGEKHPLSGKAMVKSCSYTLGPGVVKASVECTKVFNESLTKEFPGSTPVIEPSVTPATPSTRPKKSSISMKNKEYLQSEDSYPIPLSLDHTNQLLSNGEFDKQVDYFLDHYGTLESTQRFLDYSYVKTLINSGNFSLLTLLLAVANYGIKDPPPSWEMDALNLNPSYSTQEPFFASDKGKKPYDYAVGGIGISHADSGDLIDIYTSLGFPENLSTEEEAHFNKLFLKEGVFTGGWQKISFNGRIRKAPKMSKSAKVRYFDEGLTQDARWRKWAHDIVYDRDNQHFLFRLWVRKYWQRTMDTLKTKSSSKDHTISLQDAIRISRAGNSYSSKIYTMPGKDNKQQYEIYKGDESRYVRQKGFCRRCADIIGWECRNK